MVQSEYPIHQLPAIFQRFVREVGAEHWLNVIEKNKTRSQNNPFLASYLSRQHTHAHQMLAIQRELTEHRTIRPQFVGQAYEGFSLMLQTLSIIDADPGYAPKLLARVRDAFQRPDKMRALLLEYLTAVHLRSRRYVFAWPDIEDQTKSACDFRITNLDKPINIDCKSIGEDTGRRVSQWSSGLLFGSLKKEIDPLIKGLTTGLSIRITLPGKLSDDQHLHKELAIQVAKAILDGKDRKLADSTMIEFGKFEPDECRAADSLPRGDLRTLFDRLSGTRNANVIVHETPAGGAVLMAVQSAQRSRLIDSVVETLKECAAHQLPPDQPGIIVVGLQLRPGAIRSFYEEAARTNRPNAFHRLSKKFWQSGKRNHVIALIFTETGNFKETALGQMSAIGQVYVFKNAKSPHWTPHAAQIFGDPNKLVRGDYRDAQSRPLHPGQQK